MKKTISISVTDDFLTEIDDLAKKIGASRSAVIETLVNEKSGLLLLTKQQKEVWRFLNEALKCCNLSDIEGAKENIEQGVFALLKEDNPFG